MNTFTREGAVRSMILAGLISIPASSTVGMAATPPPSGAPYVSVRAASIALQHVEIIDGTGAAARADQTVVIADGRIAAVGSSSDVPIPNGSQVKDYRGYAVIPGLVGMHDHLFIMAIDYGAQIHSPTGMEPGLLVQEIPYTAPRLYLATGVTTLRTTGSMEPYTDLKVRSRIEAGVLPGPHLYVTAPYLDGRGTQFAQIHELAGPEEAKTFVDYWASTGMTSFKAYTSITRVELAAAIAAAHRHGLRVTGHLCSVSWPEAIAAGIDGFEHGPISTDSEFVADRKPDTCDHSKLEASWLRKRATDPEVARLIRSLVDHDVAITSTLPVFEAGIAGREAQKRVLDVMAPVTRENYAFSRAHLATNGTSEKVLRAEMAFERAFVAAGGLLLAGSDPTVPGVLPGFGDQREIELLVEAGFTPVEAIAIGTRNGARFLGQEKEIGTIAVGSNADLVLVRGDPATHISDIENVEVVFKDGVGYDPQQLIAAVRGQVGLR